MVHEWQISLLWLEGVYVMLFVPFLQRKKVHDVIAGLTNTYFQMLLNLSRRCKNISLLQIWELHCLKLQEYLLLKSLEKLMLVCCKYCGRYGDGEPSY
ncbi:hypothetical protein Hanom_Chr14g01301431 [Helianthus anomalus]